MRLPIILIFLLLLVYCGSSAQEKDTLKQVGIRPYYSGYSSYGISCSEAKAEAKKLYSKGYYRYLIPMQFGPDEKTLQKACS